jgi:hypothetical protein
MPLCGLALGVLLLLLTLMRLDSNWRPLLVDCAAPKHAYNVRPLRLLHVKKSAVFS